MGKQFEFSVEDWIKNTDVVKLIPVGPTSIGKTDFQKSIIGIVKNDNFVRLGVQCGKRAGLKASFAMLEQIEPNERTGRGVACNNGLTVQNEVKACHTTTI